jgi:hypothetical protein
MLPHFQTLSVTEVGVQKSLLTEASDSEEPRILASNFYVVNYYLQ